MNGSTNEYDLCTVRFVFTAAQSKWNHLECGAARRQGRIFTYVSINFEREHVTSFLSFFYVDQINVEY